VCSEPCGRPAGCLAAEESQAVCSEVSLSMKTMSLLGSSRIKVPQSACCSRGHWCCCHVHVSSAWLCWVSMVCAGWWRMVRKQS